MLQLTPISLHCYLTTNWNKDMHRAFLSHVKIPLLLVFASYRVRALPTWKPELTCKNQELHSRTALLCIARKSVRFMQALWIFADPNGLSEYFRRGCRTRDLSQNCQRRLPSHHSRTGGRNVWHSGSMQDYLRNVQSSTPTLARSTQTKRAE